jgi:F0F1-type ATP synthase delta subunit
MNDNILAAKLYKLKDKISDPILLTIKSAQLLKGADLDNVLEAYQAIIKKELTIVEVTSAVELVQEQKLKIVKAINDKFNTLQLVYVFAVDSQMSGLVIKLDDNAVDFSSTFKNI